MKFKYKSLEKWHDDFVLVTAIDGILGYGEAEDADNFMHVVDNVFKEVKDCYSVKKEAVIDLFERLYGGNDYNNLSLVSAWHNLALRELRKIEGDLIIVKESDELIEEPKSKTDTVEIPEVATGKPIFIGTLNNDSNKKSKYDIHKEICNNLHQTYIQKNEAYGDSFTDSISKFGLVAAATRMSDKYNRITNLIMNPDVDRGDEPLKDSLLDLANYCIMTAMVLDKDAA